MEEIYTQGNRYGKKENKEKNKKSTKITRTEMKEIQDDTERWKRNQ